MAEKIVITSGKGGVGKTTVSAFLGAKLAEMGKRVVVCDLDFGLNNLDIVMGVEKNVVYDLADALEGRCRASQALIKCPFAKNLYMISSVRTMQNNITGQKLKMLFQGLDDNFDYVLFDCPAGIDTGFHRAVSASDSAIVVVTPCLSSIRDSDKALCILRSYNLKSINLVVNMARGDIIADGNMLSVNQLENLLKTPVKGVIPMDDNILISRNCHLENTTASGYAFLRLAKNMTSEKIKNIDIVEKYKGFFGSIRRTLKKKL